MATFSKECSTLSMAAVTILFLGLLMATIAKTEAQSIGVCYGRLGNDLPPPSEVIALYKQHNIGRMRLFDPNPQVLQALRGSNIELLLGIPNSDLQTLSSDPSAARTWVQTNVVAYFPSVKIKYIVVGNEVSPAPGNQNSAFVNFVVPAMTNIYNAILSAGLGGQVRVSTSLDTGIIGVRSPPSEGAFRDDAMNFLNPIIGFLVDTRAAILFNIYPYFAASDDPDMDLPFALFTAEGPGFIDSNTNLEYQNLFDAMLDSVYAALAKASGSSLEIVVSESGWPSAMGNLATLDNARTYNQNLIKHVGRGSPMKPGRAIETYVFAMFNENQKTGPEFEKHFGLFWPNKVPVYPINFS